MAVSTPNSLSEEECTRRHDGVALTFRGDALLMLWNAPAVVHRSRWVYDNLDEFVRTQPGNILVLMILLSTADLPDGAARAENAVRLPRLARSLRRVVTVVEGNELRHSIVRSGLRLMTLPLGSGRSVVARTVDAGIFSLREAAGRDTPTLPGLRQAAASLYATLGLEVPSALRLAIPED